MAARWIKAAVMGMLGAGLLAAPASAAPDTPAIYGVWKNPKDTVHLEIRACQTGTCGFVIWASQKAQAEALEGSGKPLIGQQLFRNFKPDSRNVWRGQVYVPDMNKTFSGSAEVLDTHTLKAKGCLIGGLFCKSQNWTRLAPVAD